VARGSANAKRFTEILRLTRVADLTTTPSSVLAEKYRAAGTNHVTVIENHLDGELEDFGVKTPHPGVTVGWVAGSEHERDLALLPIVEVLQKLLDRHAELRVVTVGLRLPLRSERYEFRPKVPFGELLRTTADIDIGIAPLAESSRSRSSAPACGVWHRPPDSLRGGRIDGESV
jgi:hypothetical protein